MIAGSLPPFAIFFAGALIALLVRGWLRSAVLLLIPVVGALNLLGMQHGVSWQEPFLGATLTLVRVDKLSLLFGYLFHLAAFLSLVYALHERDAVQQISAVLYAGGALGAVFAGDLVVLFVFWEVLAVSSVFLVWARRTERADAAGIRYLIVQVASGCCCSAFWCGSTSPAPSPSAISGSKACRAGSSSSPSGSNAPSRACIPGWSMPIRRRRRWAP
jgi:multicomponent Na+:H+ antiporter subunit D